ncbi:hypothetical protein Q5752_003693 [Cryptotrichosporon argae]
MPALPFALVRRPLVLAIPLLALLFLALHSASSHPSVSRTLQLDKLDKVRPAILSRLGEYDWAWGGGKGGLLGAGWDEWEDAELGAMGAGVKRRVAEVEARCVGEDEWEKEYGRTNLRLSRGYEGSHQRVRDFLAKLLRGEDVTISTIGGSVTAGHHVWDNEVWFYKFGEWLDSWFPSSSIRKVNGAAPATGSDYFSFCFSLHIPTDSDLVLVELGVNDEGLPEHADNMENLLRGLLELPAKPAVVLVEAMAFSAGGMGGGGGRFHLPVAQYYDVPVINQRHPLAAHFARFPQLVRPYFAQDWWGNPDTRHLNSRGHRDLAMLIASFFKDVMCQHLSEPDFAVPSRQPVAHPLSEATDISFADQVAALDLDTERYLSVLERHWPTQSQHWSRPVPRPDDVPADQWEERTELMPGQWSGPLELGQVPRMRVADGWNPDIHHRLPAFHPTCLSARATDPAYNLTPTASDGWAHWVHDDHKDKPYLIASQPGATVEFELETNVGVVKIYSLKSQTFGLGKIACAVDGGESVIVDGYWEQSENIGRFAIIAEGLAPGTHTLACELLTETSDPGNGTEFRLISVMSV